MLILILIVLAVIVAWFVVVTVRRVGRMECYRDATTGETWEPRFLIIMYKGPGHRNDEGELVHGTTDDELSDEEKHRAMLWGHILLTAQSHGIPVEETPFAGEQYGCNWCRTFDLKQVAKQRREVMYAMAAMLIKDCRAAIVPACARIVGERDARPFGVSRFMEFAETIDGLKRLADAVFLILDHAWIPQLAGHETVLHRLLRRRITPDEFLHGMRWFVEGTKQAA